MDHVSPRRHDELRLDSLAFEPFPDDDPLIGTTVAERAKQAIVASGFPPLRVEGDKVVLSGFLVEPETHDHVKVRWIGQEAIDAEPYRRTFLRVYAVILVEAGLTVRHVTAEDDAYLVCRAS